MRIIMRNEDAERLRSTLDPAVPPSILAKNAVGDGDEIFIVVGDIEFPGIARREPNGPERLRVEDMDGHVILEAD